MGKTSIPERTHRAVDLLDVAPDDRVLEVGPGTGASLSLICARLRSGSVTAVDRSANAVAAIRRRLPDELASGRLAVLQGDLVDISLPDQSIDKILAVNVNVFWTGTAEPEFAAIRRVLRPGGTLCLYCEPPSADRVPAIEAALTANLAAAGFTARARHDDYGRTGLGLIARPSPGS
jgi:ubiquinone/menaquinone biosynthesis C-methylase UbiE